MALVLNIETASTNCSVALSKDGDTLVVLEDNNSGYSHAEKLHVFIDELFKVTNIQPKSIDAIAVSMGPGSYTGLRIGVSAAKGLCYALHKPLIAISTLESLAQQVNVKEGFIVPMLDARRMEVYSAIYTSKLDLYRSIEAEVLTEQSFHDVLEHHIVYFIGSGVAKTRKLIKHQNTRFIDDKWPSAKDMALLSEVKFNTNAIEDVAYFEPYYLKDFISTQKKA